MSDNMRYVQNVSDLLIRCKVKVTVDDQEVIKVFNFPRKKIDTIQGTLASTGYTPVTKADLQLLEKESYIFKQHVKSKKLVVHEKLPISAQSPQEIAAGLARENADLKAQIVELEKGDVKKYKERITELEKAMKDGEETLTEANKGLDEEIKSWNGAYVELLEAAKKGGEDLTAYIAKIEALKAGK